MTERKRVCLSEGAASRLIVPLVGKLERSVAFYKDRQSASAAGSPELVRIGIDLNA